MSQRQRAELGGKSGDDGRREHDSAFGIGRVKSSRPDQYNYYPLVAAMRSIHVCPARRKPGEDRIVAGVLKFVACLVLAAVCAACSEVLPGPDTGIPVTITNDDDEAATVEMTLYNATHGRGRTVMEPFDLAPGEVTIVRLEPTRGRAEAFHLIINGFVATSSEFLGCDIAELDGPLPEELVVVVLPNGEPGVCP